MDDVEKAEFPKETSPTSDRSSRSVDRHEDGKTQTETVQPRREDDLPTSNLDTVLVDWETNDTEFPQNFTRRRKFIITLTAAGLTLTVTFSASVFSAAILQTSERFNVSTEVMILGTSLFVLGFGLGPTIFGPLSELYGRKFPLFIGFVGFAIFQIPVAVAQNLPTVLVCRFLQGMFGSSPTAVIGGILADIWNARERGFAMPSFAGTLFAGPICGPIAGAYISDSSLGWRWTQWITLIMAGFFGIVAFVNVPETFAPVLLVHRAKRLRKETGNTAFRAKHEENKVNFKDIVNRYLLRPSKMLCLEPILTLITIYLSFVFGLLFLFFEAYPISFVGSRGWAPGVASLPFISILIGVFIGCALLAFTTKTRLSPDPQKGRAIETRLLLMSIGAIALPVGLFWFAWTSYPSINPWPQIIAGVPIGFSVIVITLQGINYTIDCYTLYANSAIASITLVRSFFGAGFPLFATSMYADLGVQWATSVLAFISVALIPVPVLFYIYGAKIRGWSKYVPT